MLIRLDCLVVHTSLVLCHQNIILLALLVCLDLLVERVKVLLLSLLPLQLLLLFSVLLHRVMMADLLGIHSIVLATKYFLLLLCVDLIIEHPVGFCFETIIKLSLFLDISLSFGISLSKLLDHDLFIALFCFFYAAHRLVVAVKVVLGIVLQLVVFELFEVPHATLLVLLHLPRLLLSKDFVRVLDLLEVTFFLNSLLLECVCIVLSLS